MKSRVSISKQLSKAQITRLLKKSKSQKCPIAINGTGIFIKCTKEDDNQWYCMAYDCNPSIGLSYKSVRLKVPKAGIGRIEGFDRLQNLAKKWGVHLSLKEVPIKTHEGTRC